MAVISLLLALAAGADPAPVRADAISAAVARARAALPPDWRPTAGARVVVELPAGRLRGAAFVERSGHSPLDKVPVGWLGAATLELRGHPDGTTIAPMHDEDGWGVSLEVRPHPAWEGRIAFHDLVIEASGASCVDLGAFGASEAVPLQDVRFVRCRFVDHPKRTVSVCRPISANQTSLHFEECEWDLPRSEEHAVYSRNPYGPASMVDCRVVAVGGQVWQEVARPSEGARHAPDTTRIEGCTFTGYHRNPGRAGSALTMAGSGRDWIVRDCVVMDLEPSPLTGPPDTTNGGFVAWDGGRYYDLEGRPVHTDDQDESLEGRFANRSLLVEGCLFVQANANRSPFQLSSLAEATVRDSAVFANRPIDLVPHARSAGIGRLEWTGNNRDSHRARARALGVPDEHLLDPRVRLRGDVIGNASRDFVLEDGEVVDR